INVFKDEGNTRVIIFSALVGALITLTQASGGVQGFVDFIQKRKLVTTRRRASGFAFIVGCSVFIESSISCLVTGTIFHPIFEKFKISREKLAYFCDATASPVCVLLPLNAWGAYIISLLDKEGLPNSFSVFFQTIPLNFYAILTVILSGFIAFSFKDFGTMKKAEIRSLELGKTIRDGAVPVVSEEITNTKAKKGIPHRALNMVIPILTMAVMMPISLVITGNGDLTAGSGSTSVLWSVSLAIVVASIMYMWQRLMDLNETVNHILKGIGGLIPLAILMTFAFAIGDTCRALGTGPYVASVANSLLSEQFLAPVIFVTSMLISFSTGTSWGTFAIMMPIAVPTALLMGVNLPLTIAAVLSGSVFGDHCSPISDTTIVSSMASASDHVDHVWTQIPYALTAAVGALILFTIFGFILY
ncbi:MAG: sodium:solute symporter, partial [Ignavibacteriaceae bacterium]|nr:sodium:solute symporter [Ignavibacteriaceae bacterium]